MAVDLNKEIRRAVDTGKVVFGSKESEKSILKGDGELIILSGKVPRLSKEKLVAQSNAAGIPVLEFGGSAADLGSVCGKPFAVLAMVVLDAGKSKLLAETGKPRQ